MNGSLKSKSFPRLLCELWKNKASGTLQLHRRLVEKVFYFHKGLLIHAESNLLHETVASYCVKEGLINDQQREQALGMVEKSGNRIGEVIVKQGWVEPMTFYKVLRDLLIFKVVDCFLWDDGDFEFDDQEVSKEGMISLNVDPFRVLVKGINTIMPFETMRQNIGLILNKPTRVVSAKLPPWAEGYLTTMALKLIKAFHEPKKPRFVMQELDIQEEIMLRIVYLFDVTGLIVNTDKPLSKEAPPKPPKPKTPEVPEEIQPIFDAPTSEPTPPPTASAKAPTAPPPQIQKVFGLDEERTKALTNEVVTLSLKLDNANHFELLGLEESATVTAVRIAYLKLLERFSLAYFREGELAEYRDQVESILLAGGEAFADLRTAGSKTKYIDKLKAKRQAESAGPKKRPGAAFTINTKLLDADSQFEEGLQHLEERNFDQAIKHFEYTRDINGHEPVYGAYLAWAKHQKDGERYALEVSELFDQVIKTGGEHPKVNMLYGKYLMIEGKTKKALKHLEKASTLAPKDVEIQRSFRVAKADAAK